MKRFFSLGVLFLILGIASHDSNISTTKQTGGNRFNYRPRFDKKGKRGVANLGEKGADWFPDSEKYRCDRRLVRIGDGGGVSASSTGGEDEFPRIPVEVPPGLEAEELPPNMVDCVAINDNPLYISCEAPEWQDIHKDQFPDSLMYLKVSGTGITELETDSFAGKEIVYLELTGQRLDRIQVNAFRGIQSLDALNLRDNVMSVKDRYLVGYFEQFKPLTNLTQLILERNSLTLADIDSQKPTSEATIMPDLEYISLKNNELQRIESFFFYPLRQSPVRELNLNSCGLRSLGKQTFEFLPYLEHVDFYNNPFLMLGEQAPLVGSSLSTAMIRMNEEYFRSLGLGSTNQLIVPTLTTFFLRKTLSRLNLSGNHVQGVGKLTGSPFDSAAFPLMENLTELILEDNRIVLVEENAFENLSSLKLLDLSLNRLPGEDNRRDMFSRIFMVTFNFFL